MELHGIELQVMELAERVESYAGGWSPDPLAREPGSLCVSERAGLIRTWGLASIGWPELVIRDCPADRVEVAKALLWDLAAWLISCNHRPRAGEVVRIGDAEARLEPGEEGLELWVHDPDAGGFAPGIILGLAGKR